MKGTILTLTFILFGSISIFSQHCPDSTFQKPTIMNCCVNGVQMSETHQKTCCVNQNAAGASTPNGHCPNPKTAKVKAVKAIAKPKED